MNKTNLAGKTDQDEANETIESSFIYKKWSNIFCSIT